MVAVPPRTTVVLAEVAATAAAATRRVTRHPTIPTAAFCEDLDIPAPLIVNSR
jgi:hypothetical protein